MRYFNLYFTAHMAMTARAQQDPTQEPGLSGLHLVFHMGGRNPLTWATFFLEGTLTGS